MLTGKLAYTKNEITKLSDAIKAQNEEYKKQLSIYKEFVEDAFNVKTNCYLLSIIDQNIKELQ